MESTKNQLTARMNSIVAGRTTDTEILDARVDADGKTYANLSERLKAVDAYYAGADAETVDGTAHGSLAKYIHEEWRNDYDLIRGGTFYKGHVDVSGLNTSDDMSGRVDPYGEGYSLAWSSVMLAYHNVGKIGEVVDRPKALGDIRGVSYIYGMFYRFGLIDVPDKVKEKMKK